MKEEGSPMNCFKYGGVSEEIDRVDLSDLFAGERK